MQYGVVIMSPKELVKPGGEFEKLLRISEFVSHILGEDTRTSTNEDLAEIR
jgi:hypothetical protein